MPKYVKISPLARVGGQLGLTNRINNSKVSAAYVHGEMFRGIEKLLLKRDPRDAPVVTSRTCGKSHFINRHVSLRNIENAAGWIFPMPQAFDAYGNDQIKFEDDEQPGYGSNTDDLWLGDGTTGRTFQRTTSPSGTIPGVAQMARNMVQLITYIYSHITHLGFARK